MQQISITVRAGYTSLVWDILLISILVGFDVEFSLEAVFVLSLFVYCNYMLWRTVLKNAVAPLELSFWIFHTNFFLLPAFSQVAHKQFYGIPYSCYHQKSLFFTCLIILLGLLAFRFGTGRARNSINKISRKFTKQYFLFQQFHVTLAMYVTIAIILIFVSIMIWKLGFQFFTTPRMERSTIANSQADFGLYFLLPMALSLGVLLFLTAFIVQSSRLKIKIPLSLKLAFFAAIGVNAIVNYPLSISRFWFFGSLITLIWIVLPLRSKKWRAAFVVGLMLSQLTVFPLFSQITRGKGFVGLNLDAFRRYMFHGDFDGFQQLLNIILYIQNHGFELGRNLISVILFFVPRAVWNKAEPLGTAASCFVGYQYTNRSAPIYGEFYADFGLFSLVIGMGALGVVVRLLDGYYNNLISISRVGVGILLSSTFAGYFIIILRGSLLGVIPSIATLFGTIFILSWISIRGKPMK